MALIRLAFYTSNQMIKPSDNVPGFKWLKPLTIDEQAALTEYKDQAWIRLNEDLRKGISCEARQSQIALLNQAILKGICTVDVTLYRGTGAGWISPQSTILQPSLGFLSTSANHRVERFFDENQPVLLVIECPAGMHMASFQYDRGGEEEERLLAPGMTFTITSKRMIKNTKRTNFLRAPGEPNFLYMGLREDQEVAIYYLKPLDATRPP